MQRRILNVAEKPSIARLITKYLSNNRFDRLDSNSKYNPIFEFDYKFEGEECTMITTSVTGHIKELRFSKEYKNWNEVQPKTLITEAEVISGTHDDKMPIVQNLAELSADLTDLILWLDCDREGEAICFEVLEACFGEDYDDYWDEDEGRYQKDGVNIYRAKFSAATQKDILGAIEDLQAPNPFMKDVSQERLLLRI